MATTSLWSLTIRWSSLQATQSSSGTVPPARRTIYGRLILSPLLNILNRSKRNGYCLATSNYHKNLIAAADYGLNPEVHIFRYPSKELVTRFKADTTIKMLDMAFSRDGRYLLMIGGIPDFRISIFDIELNKKFSIKPDVKLPCKPQEYKKVKFNPVNDREFAILSTNCVYFFSMVEGFEGQLVESQ